MFLASSLDVISVVIGVLKEQSLSLIQSTNLLAVMASSMDDNDEIVRQSAFGVLGDIAQYCYAAIQDHLAQFTQLCVKHMNIEYVLIRIFLFFNIMIMKLIIRYSSICNNAIWSLGEMVLRAGQSMAGFMDSILPLLVSFNVQTGLPAGIRDNSTIAICRSCLVIPQCIQYVQNHVGMLCMNVARLR